MGKRTIYKIYLYKDQNKWRQDLYYLKKQTSLGGRKSDSANQPADLMVNFAQPACLWQETLENGQQVLVKNFEPAIALTEDTGKELNEIDWQKVKLTKVGLSAAKPKAGDFLYYVTRSEYVKLEKQEGNSQSDQWHAVIQIDEKNTEKV